MPYTRGVVIEVDPEDREWLSVLQAQFRAAGQGYLTRPEVFKRLRACWEAAHSEGQAAK